MNTNEIKWIDLVSNARGRKQNELKDFEFSVYKNYKVLKSNAGNYLTLSEFMAEIYLNQKMQVGFLGERIIFKFNNDVGLSMIKDKKGFKNCRINSAQLVELIHKNCGYNIESSRNVYSLTDIGNNTFIVTRKV